MSASVVGHILEGGGGKCKSGKSVLFSQLLRQNQLKPSFWKKKYIPKSAYIVRMSVVFGRLVLAVGPLSLWILSCSPLPSLTPNAAGICCPWLSLTLPEKLVETAHVPPLHSLPRPSSSGRISPANPGGRALHMGGVRKC